MIIKKNTIDANQSAMHTIQIPDLCHRRARGEVKRVITNGELWRERVIDIEEKVRRHK